MTIKPLHAPESRQSGAERVGRVVGWCPETRCLLVDYPDNDAGPLRSSSIIQVSEQEAQAFAETQQEVLLCFDAARPEHPIILGVLKDAVARPDAAVGPAKDIKKALILEHDQRIEIRCGNATLVFTKNGKILMRGAYISSHASGAFRVRGGSVDIN